MAFLEPLVWLALLLGGPWAVLRRQPHTPTALLFLGLLGPLALFSGLVAHTSDFGECIEYTTARGCWSWKGLFWGLSVLLYAMILGWCEAAWRHRNESSDIAWPYRLASNLIIVLSCIVGATIIGLLAFQVLSPFWP